MDFQSLDGDRTYVKSPCNSPIKYYIDIIYKENVPSFHCKMSFGRSTPAGEVDGLSLILVNFYVTTLTPRLYCSDAALELPENITLFEVCCIYINVSSSTEG
jgi:hypothetical protein